MGYDMPLLIDGMSIKGSFQTLGICCSNHSLSAKSVFIINSSSMAGLKQHMKIDINVVLISFMAPYPRTILGRNPWPKPGSRFSGETLAASNRRTVGHGVLGSSAAPQVVIKRPSVCAWAWCWRERQFSRIQRVIKTAIRFDGAKNK